MTIAFLLLAVICLAYANGANDNFKGVATLFGSRTASFRVALVWATMTTLIGSLAAVLLAGRLLKAFSGKGLVDSALVSSADYAAAVALGAGLTVLLATRIGMPISTTHSLIGALVGAGWMAGSSINLAKLGSGYFLPLLLSPIMAVILTALLYQVFRFARTCFGVSQETCICVGREIVEVVPCGNPTVALQRVEQLSISTDDVVTCQNRYQGRVLGIQAASLLDRLHFLSAGIVSFARGLNDTPKIAALLLVSPALSGLGSMALVGVTIAMGGLLSARRVADTMSNRITQMNHGQGFTANLITGCIVIGASPLGFPVSTTHVSCGSLFGIGATTGQGHWHTVRHILAAWLVTLPAGALIGALAYAAFSRL